MREIKEKRVGFSPFHGRHVLASQGEVNVSTRKSGEQFMPLVPLRVILDHAAENDYGVAAFNVNNMEQIQAIMEAANETDSPVIVQASRGARSWPTSTSSDRLKMTAFFSSSLRLRKLL